MFVLKSGKPKIEYYAKKASTVFEVGDLVYFDGSGAIQPADATSGDHIGVILKKIAATDSDYASNTKVPVITLTDDVLFEVDVDTGTALTAAMVGSQYDLTDANSLNVGGTSKLVVTIVEFISATKAVVKINASIAVTNVSTT